MAKVSGKIAPFLWFDTQGEEAARFYCSVFKRSKLGKISRYPEGSPGTAGAVMTVDFRIEGQDFIALNGGPQFKFTEAVSFLVHCKDQKEIDYYWDKLLQGGGKPVQCGWLRDRYGLSWQVAPTELMKLWSGKDKARAQRAMQAMMGMVKLDLAALRRAARGK
jgi:predicted 3-demethylubiquinone-9 3-methyltransferase (glyoxalase superfamily)